MLGTPLQGSHKLTALVHITIQKQEDVCTYGRMMAWSKTGPTLRKKYQVTDSAHILGVRDTLGSAGPGATKTSNTTPPNSGSQS